jgi:hypothetical protein
VIFQNRIYEGLASRTSNDFSRDDYFCLSYDTAKSKQDALDAVSCASQFNSDKGRFMTEDDVQGGYWEPYEDPSSQVGRKQRLTLDSLYPPRRDVRRCVAEASCCSCYDHADVADFDAHAREIMPDIDAVSMATPQGGEEQHPLYAVPEDWPAGSYRACIEVNVEGDYNAVYDDEHFRTPQTPELAWDEWATRFGYPYRGQPSVVYCMPFDLGGEREVRYSTQRAQGSTASWDTAADSFGTLESMDTLTDEPERAPGSGGDRLRQNAQGERFAVVVKPADLCSRNSAPSGVTDLRLAQYPERRQAHERAELEFHAASDDTGVFRYDVRVSVDPIVDEASFVRGQPAKNDTTAAEALGVPSDVPSGRPIRVGLGGLIADTHYYVGVRAVDGCNAGGPVEVAQITTPLREFATVTPCFVATAAYGSPLAHEIGALRRLRDRQLSNNVLGRAFVAAYGRLGPELAGSIRRHETLRAAARALLVPWVALARLAE